MKRLFLSAVALGLGAGQTLSTDYGRDRSLTVSVVSKSETETTVSEMTIDGEPREGRGMGGNLSSERSYSFTDTVLAANEGAPQKVKRAFGEVGGTMTMPSRDGAQEIELESDFTDAVVVIDATGDETTVEVLEGKLEPEQLAGLVPTLALDRLLPGKEVETGESWELEGVDFLAAVGHEFERNLFRRPAPEGGEGEGRGRGGRGQGGPMGGRMGGGLAMLESGEWDAKATLTDETEEVDGLECAVVTIDVEVSGELPEGGGFGRGGRERAFGLVAPAPANTFEAALEGRLLWSTKEARPVKLTLTGKIETVRSMERETERGVWKSHTEQETRLDLTVEVTSGAKAE